MSRRSKKKQNLVEIVKYRNIVNKVLDKNEMKIRSPWIKLEQKLNESMASIAAGTYTAKDAAQTVESIERFRRQANLQLDRVIEDSIKTGRNSSTKLLGNRVNTAGQQKTINAAGRKVLVSKQDTLILEAIKSDMDKSVDEIAFTIGRKHDDVVRQVQLKAIDQIGSTLTPKEAADVFEEALSEAKLIKNSGGFQFVELSEMNYNLKSYSEMLGRTTTREAFTRGTIEQLVLEGGDLVEIDESVDSCDLCKPYEGQIYSISGTSKEYPPLEEQPPFHPNCTHVVMPVG